MREPNGLRETPQVSDEKHLSHEAERQERKKTLLSALRHVFLAYLLASLLSGRPGIFAGLCAGLPAALPVVLCGEDAGIRERLIHSVLWGVPGIAAAAAFLLLAGGYATAAWLAPAATGTALCAVYAFTAAKLTGKKRAFAQSAVLIAVMFVCFL